MSSQINDENSDFDSMIDALTAIFTGKHESTARYNEILDLKKGLASETDRGCGLMVGAYLDELTKEFLAALFVNDKEAQKEFLRPDGPLGTFSSRIDLCYLLGQISALERRELHLLRKIRNEFAHSATSKDFSDMRILQRIKELKCTGLEDKADPRHRLVRSCIFLSAHFHSMIWSDRRLLTPPNPDIQTLEKVHKIQMNMINQVISEDES